jgi:hypothetical protein
MSGFLCPGPGSGVLACCALGAAQRIAPAGARVGTPA